MNTPVDQDEVNQAMHVLRNDAESEIAEINPEITSLVSTALIPNRKHVTMTEFLVLMVSTVQILLSNVQEELLHKDI